MIILDLDLKPRSYNLEEMKLFRKQTMIKECIYSPMTDKNIDSVMFIEKAVFRHPWTRDFFRLIISDKKNYVITIRYGKEIIGYGGYHLIKDKVNFLNTKKDYRGIIHLINIAIHPDYQHRGFGTTLLKTLLKNAVSQNAEYCYLEVRPSNTKAIAFYRKFGFSVIGIIENYYPQENENALVMGLELH